MKQPSRTHRNQRLSRNPHRQQQVLEVTLQADKERRIRMRHNAVLFVKVIALAALSAGVWVGAQQALRRLIWENHFFYLSQLHVTTDGALTRDQILAAAGVVEGRNIFLYDLGKVRAALDKLPQVDRVEVDRTLPNQIDIEINERQPIAWIAAPGDIDPTASEHSFLVDKRGYVMRTRKLLQEYYSLPIITGVETGNLEPGRKVTDYEVQAALKLLQLTNDNTRWQIGSVDVSKGYCLVATDREHAKITFGLDNIDEQLATLYRLFEVIEPAHQIRTVNLFVQRNIPVTYVEPGAPDGADADSTPPPIAASDQAKPGDKATDKTSTGKSKADPKDNKTSAKSSSTPSPAKKSESTSKFIKKPFRAQANGQ
ncbi:MAG TPA: FtsQ-type POTRA domain-containing protein [Chthoniobacteraceae bacterium]|jgi:cell division protein FtsQ